MYHFSHKGFLEMKTVGHSFRINEEYLAVLQEEAEKQTISVNALMNKILQQYTVFGRFSERFGMITVGNDVFADILECCPEEDIIRIGKTVGTFNAKDFFRTMRIPLDFKSVIYLVTKVLCGPAGWAKCDHYFASGKEILHFRHNLGANWTKFIATAASSVFESILGKKVKVELLKGSVTLTIE